MEGAAERKIKLACLEARNEKQEIDNKRIFESAKRLMVSRMGSEALSKQIGRQAEESFLSISPQPHKAE